MLLIPRDIVLDVGWQMRSSRTWYCKSIVAGRVRFVAMSIVGKATYGFHLREKEVIAWCLCISA